MRFQGHHVTIIKRAFIWVFPKKGYPKMDGENNGTPYEQMDDLGGIFPLFLEGHPFRAHHLGIPRQSITKMDSSFINLNPPTMGLSNNRMSSCTEWLHRIALFGVTLIVLILMGSMGCTKGWFVFCFFVWRSCYHFWRICYHFCYFFFVGKLNP